MTQFVVKIVDGNGLEVAESLESYCKRLGKKNNSLLFKLEKYLNKKLLSDDELIEIRDLILTSSAEISRLANYVHVGDENEGL